MIKEAIALLKCLTLEPRIAKTPARRVRRRQGPRAGLRP